MDDFKTFLRINPYPHYLGIAFNMEMRAAILEEAGVEPSEIEVREYGAITEFYRNGTHAAALCVVTFFQDDEIPHWTMAHEAVHVANDVMERCGIIHDTRNDEAFAYLIEWVVRMMVFAQDAWNNRDSHKGAYFTDIIRTRLRMAQNERSEQLEVTAPFPDARPVTPTGKAADILGSCPRNVYQVVMPVGLHPDTQTLVAGIAQDMANKLMKAQEKYGWTNGWRDERFTPAMWTEETIRHIQKGDPLDVINYMAFARDRKWSSDLLVDGFSAMFVKLEQDKLAVQELNRADMLLDAVKHEQAIDPDNTTAQYESLAVASAVDEVNKDDVDEVNYEFPVHKFLNIEPCCPHCQAGTVRYTSKASPRFYCSKCGAEFDKYGVR